MGYTFTKLNNITKIVHTDGREWELSVQPSVYMENGMFFLSGDKINLSFKSAELDLIGGNAPAGTNDGILVQLAGVIPIPGAGTGSTAISNLSTAIAGSDGMSNPTTASVLALHLVYNGTTYDRLRGNYAEQVVASATQTTSGQSAALTNWNARNANFIINVSAASGTTPVMVLKMQMQDIVSGTWVDIPGALTANIITTGASLLSIGSGLTAVANL